MTASLRTRCPCPAKWSPAGRCRVRRTSEVAWSTSWLMGADPTLHSRPRSIDEMGTLKGLALDSAPATRPASPALRAASPCPPALWRRRDGSRPKAARGWAGWGWSLVPTEARAKPEGWAGAGEVRRVGEQSPSTPTRKEGSRLGGPLGSQYPAGFPPERVSDAASRPARVRTMTLALPTSARGSGRWPFFSRARTTAAGRAGSW